LKIHLRALAGQLNKLPSTNDINKAGNPSSGNYINRFGNMKKAYEAAGLNTDKYTPKYSDEQLKTHLQDLARQLNRLPRPKDINESGKPISMTYRNRFGSMKKAYEAAGLDTKITK
jgi:hypothetical protein